MGGCYAEAQRDRIFERYPFIDVAFGPGTIHHLGDWLSTDGVGVARSAFGTADARRFSAVLAHTAGATVSGMGSDLHGLQLRLLVLHRARPLRAGG